MSQSNKNQWPAPYINFGELHLIDFSTFTPPGAKPGPMPDISGGKAGVIDFPGITAPKLTSAAKNGAGLIALSDVIDAFGIDSTHPEWENKYSKMDLNRNGIIDVEDISSFAKNI